MRCVKSGTGFRCLQARGPAPASLRGLAGAGLLALVAACGGEPAPVERAPVIRPVKTFTVGEATASPRSYPGRVQAADRVDLSFRVGGPLVELAVREGEQVARGELLARLDPRDFRIRVDGARAEFEKAEADYRRIAALYEKDAASKSQLDQAQAAVDIARARLDDARAALSDTELKAPFEARVGERYVDNFTDVQAKQPILYLVNTDRVEIVVDLPETVVARLQGRQAEHAFVARFDALAGRDFPLEFKEIANQADPGTQTYRTTFSMAQPEELNVLSGMTATVTWTSPSGGKGGGRILIPAVALIPGEAGGQAVWVVDPASGEVSRRNVTTAGPVGSDQAAVTSGLEPGDIIAISAVSSLREGQPVRPLGE